MAKKRITLSEIKALVNSPASGTKIFVWDTEVRGFGVYRTSKGRPTFVYQYRFDDRPSQRATIGQLGELTVEQARAEASNLAHQRRTGTDPVGERKRKAAAEKAKTDLVISSYFDRYVERRRTGEPVSANQITVFRRDLVAHIGEKRLDRLTTEDIDKFRQTLFARGPSMVRSGLVSLKTLINDAVARGTIANREAFAFDVPSTGKRTRRLDEWEVRRLLEAARDIGDARGDVIEVLIRMGKRKEEIAELPWEEVDLAKGHWRLPPERTKNKRAALILLPHQVVSIMARQQPDPTKRAGPIFTLNGTTPTEMGSQVKDILDANLHRRVEAANGIEGTNRRIPHFTLHDVRKVPSSSLAEAPFRYPRDLINSMLLHVTGGQLDEVYILTAMVQETGDMVQAWNDHVDEIMARPDSWPGGRDLPPMKPIERKNRLADLRSGWEQRSDQKRATAARAEGPKRKRRRKD